jgi:hypothetical protein
MIRAAFDASMDSPSGVTAVGGYLGLVGTWDRLEERWSKRLAARGLDRFRATDIFQRYRRDEAIKCCLEFSGLINSSGLRFACAHMLDTDWTSIDKNSAYLELYPQRQHACLDMLLNIIAEVVTIDFADLPISIVFDNDYGNTEFAGRVYDAWRTRKGHSGFQSVTFIKGENEWDAIPLQCADLLAGLTRRTPHSREALNALNEPIHGEISDETRALLRAMPNGRGTRWSLAIARELEEIIKKRNQSEVERAAS